MIAVIHRKLTQASEENKLSPEESAREVQAIFLDPANETRIGEDLDSGRYFLRAFLEVSDLDEAWDKTQNIDGAWQDASGVVAGMMPVRSSMVGDIFVFETGEAFLVNNQGFHELSSHLAQRFAEIAEVPVSARKP